MCAVHGLDCSVPSLMNAPSPLLTSIPFLLVQDARFIEADPLFPQTRTCPSREEEAEALIIEQMQVQPDILALVKHVVEVVQRLDAHTRKHREKGCDDDGHRYEP